MERTDRGAAILAPGVYALGAVWWIIGSFAEERSGKP
jgi:hypothetical protein